MESRQHAERRTLPKILSIIIATVLMLGLCPGFSRALAYGDETDQAIPASEDTITVYRLYNKWSGEHLFTAKTSERDNLTGLGWNDEGVAWKAPKTSDKPIYRLYNPYDYEHFYTTNKSEYDQLDAMGWNGEDVAYYSASEDEMPIYRLRNPYGSGVTAHLFTKSETEKANLISLGYEGEGIGWYGLKDEGSQEPSKPENPPTLSEGVVYDENVGEVTANSWGTPDASGYISSVTVPKAEGAGIAKGQTLMIEPDEDHLAGTTIVVDSVAETDGGYVISGSKPKLEDVVDSIKISGSTSDFRNVQMAQGVSLVSNDQQDPSVMTLSIAPGEYTESRDEYGIATADTGGGTIDIGDETFTITEGFTLTVKPSFDYAYDYDEVLGMKMVQSAKLVSNLETTLGLGFEIKDDFEKELCSGEFVIPDTPFTIKAKLSLVATINGELKVEVTMTKSAGFEYSDHKVKTINKDSLDWSATMSGKMQGGVRPAAMLTFAGFANLAYLDVEGGIAIEGSETVRSTGMVCCDASAYFYAQMSLDNDENLVGDALKLFGQKTTYPLVEKSSSNNLFAIHTEDGKVMPNGCTWGEEQPEPDNPGADEDQYGTEPIWELGRDGLYELKEPFYLNAGKAIYFPKGCDISNLSVLLERNTLVKEIDSYMWEGSRHDDCNVEGGELLGVSWASAYKVTESFDISEQLEVITGRVLISNGVAKNPSMEIINCAQEENVFTVNPNKITMKVGETVDITVTERVHEIYKKYDTRDTAAVTFGHETVVPGATGPTSSGINTSWKEKSEGKGILSVTAVEPGKVIVNVGLYASNALRFEAPVEITIIG